MGQCHSQSETHISELPNEVVFNLLKHLSPQEMKSVVLVCNYLRRMGEEPRFWAWAVLTVNTKEDLHRLKRPRFQMVEEIDVANASHGGTEGLADLFQGIVEMTPKVRRIRGLEFCKGMEGIAPGLVVSVLNSIERLKLCYGDEAFYGEIEGIELDDEDDDGEEMTLCLTPEQLQLLFKTVAEETNLKFLHVAGQELDELSPTIDSLFAAAVTNVEEVVLKEWSKGDITNEQYEAIYRMVAARDRPLRKLSCLSDYIDPIGDTDPDLLSKAFNRLEEVSIYGSPDIGQFTAILRGLVEGGSRLKKLRFSWDDRYLGETDPDLLGKALNMLEEFVCDGCCTGEQLTAILSGLVEGDSRLKKLMFRNLYPEIIQDQNLVSRAEEKIGKFYK